MKIKQEQDPFCKKPTPYTAENPLARRTRSKISHLNLKIKQEEDPCKTSRTQAAEGLLSTRTRSKVSIKKEEALQQKLRT